MRRTYLSFGVLHQIAVNNFYRSIRSDDAVGFLPDGHGGGGSVGAFLIRLHTWGWLWLAPGAAKEGEGDEEKARK